MQTHCSYVQILPRVRIPWMYNENCKVLDFFYGDNNFFTQSTFVGGGLVHAKFFLSKLEINGTFLYILPLSGITDETDVQNIII